MKQIVSKKNLSMYTFTLDEEGTLQIQAPTLFKPLMMQAQQAQELALWLVDAYQLSTPQQPEPTFVSSNESPATSPTIAETSTAQQESAPVIEPPVPTEQPLDIAQRVIREAIEQAREQYPEVLNPENHDRFLNQILRAAAIKPLLAQNLISRKQILLLVEQDLGS
jgi:hypothetical protein